MNRFDCRWQNEKWGNKSKRRTTNEPAHGCYLVHASQCSSNIDQHRHDRCQEDDSRRIAGHRNRTHGGVQQGTGKKSKVDRATPRTNGQGVAEQLEGPFAQLVAYRVEELVDHRTNYTGQSCGRCEHGRQEKSAAPDRCSEEDNCIGDTGRCHEPMLAGWRFGKSAYNSKQHQRELSRKSLDCQVQAIAFHRSVAYIVAILTCLQTQ